MNIYVYMCVCVHTQADVRLHHPSCRIQKINLGFLAKSLP